MLISSYWGMYAVQTVLHSFTASVLSYCALLAWNLKSPRIKQQFYFMVIFLPLISFPLYQMVSPRRGDVYFRLGNSLLDSNKWFFLELMDGVSLFILFIIVTALTSVIFLVQELAPIILHLLKQMRGGNEPDADEADEELALKVSKALAGLPADMKSVEILNDEDLALFSSTGLNPKIYVSTGLITSFTSEHLHTALAHEIGHIQRSRKPVLLLAYIFRMIMFYNPIAMIEFRKLAQEEEKVCDDIAIALTGKPEALAEAIDMLRPEEEEHTDASTPEGVKGIVRTIEHHSHDALLKSRCFRIRQSPGDDLHWGVPYIVTMLLIISLNYFIV